MSVSSFLMSSFLMSSFLMSSFLMSSLMSSFLIDGVHTMTTRLVPCPTASAGRLRRDVMNRGNPPAPTPPRVPKEGVPKGTPLDWGNPEAPWDENTIQLWVDEIDAVPWVGQPTQNPVRWYKSLPCPRCTHTMTIEVGGGGLLTARAEDEPTPAWCNCHTADTVHGRPDDHAYGCGQGAPVRRPP